MLSQLRLNKFIADCQIASRRGADTLIAEGRVRVNGMVITKLGSRIDPESDVIKIGNRVIKPSALNIYIAFNKPDSVVSTLSDPEGRPTIKDYLPPHKGTRLYPAGRLDYHSEGLMILTNDGNLANDIMHPRFKVEKIYKAKVKGNPAASGIDKLKKGIRIDGRKSLPCKIYPIPSEKTIHSWWEIHLYEGRKNQIRDMFLRIGHPVIKLRRITIGPIELGGLREGSCRYLSMEEITRLKSSLSKEGKKCNS